MRNMKSGLVQLRVFVLWLVLFSTALSAHCQRSTNDLWDVSRGTVVITNSAVYGECDARDILGGLFGPVFPDQCMFLDNQSPSPGFVHFIEWKTQTDVSVGGFALFAAGDGPASNNQREFSQFVLRAKSSPQAAGYDLVLFDYVVPNHPYVFIDPASYLLLFTNITPVTSSFFRAEFVERSTGGLWDAPRVYELDGYPPAGPIITLQPTSQEVFVGNEVSLMAGAFGLPTLSYQWLFNGSNIVGETNQSLRITNVQLAHAGNYSLVVSNAFGFTNSLQAVLTVLPAPPCTPGPTNAISWWRAEGTTSDHVSGNNGTFVGNATFGSGRLNLGQGFTFDGNGDFVNLGNPATLQSQNFTIEAWIRRASSTIVNSGGTGALIFGYGSGGYGFGILDAGQLFLSKVGLSNVILTNTVADTNWHHVAVTKTGSAVNFYIDGVAYPVAAYNPGFVFSTSAAIGARGDGQGGSFFGQIDETTFYSRALTPSEIQTAFSAGSSGKCLDLVPPTIVSVPQTTNVVAGSNVTLNVVAGGSLPLKYQWRFNGSDIAGATNTSLTVSNVQFSSMGSYSVVVTNSAGSTVSSAILNVVFPPATVRVLASNAMAGASIVVPITLAANGNENSFGFSLNYSTQRLAYAGVALGSGAVGANLFVNTSLTSTGRLGVAIAFPSSVTFPTATQEVVRVLFSTLPLLGAQPANTTVSFADQPVLRELSDSLLQPLSANYSNSTFILSPTVFEGDVSPRTNGNQSVSVTDWLQMGRFVARLEAIASANEFQRADCAPSVSHGDAQLKVTDWVQAGRYLAGTEVMAAVGGPTIETNASIAGPSVNRRLFIANASVLASQMVAATIELEAQGDENALGFTLAYNPASLTFIGIESGDGTSGASFLINTNQTASGRVGVVLALNPGSTFGTGLRRLATATFATSTATGTFPLTLTDHVATRCVSDAAANELPVGFVGGNITVNATNTPPTLFIARSSNSVILSWASWAGDFSLQTALTLNGVGNAWTNLPGLPQTNGGEIRFALPVTNQAQFFRLRR